MPALTALPESVACNYGGGAEGEDVLRSMSEMPIRYGERGGEPSYAFLVSSPAMPHGFTISRKDIETQIATLRPQTANILYDAPVVLQLKFLERLLHYTDHPLQPVKLTLVVDNAKPNDFGDGP